MRKSVTTVISVIGLSQVLVSAGLSQPATLPIRLYVAEYAVNDGRILSMNLDGSGSATVLNPPPTEWLLVGIDIDSAVGELYWSNGNFNSSTIRRSNANGANPKLLLGNLKLVRGMALDAGAGKLYWANSPSGGNASGLIERANVDGTERETVYTQSPYDPIVSYVGPPAIDPVNGYVYFCADQEIRRVRLDGTGAPETVVKGVNTVVGLALDVASNHIYFIDANTNTDFLGRANLDGSDFVVLVDQSPGVSVSSLMYDLKVDLARGKAYWTNDLAGNVGAVQRVDLAGGSVANVENVYIDTDGHVPTALCFDHQPPQPILDCNHNSIRDLDDIETGTSADCNLNGIPDECETSPCVPEPFLIDNGTVPGQSGRTLSGDPSSGYEVFQPFDVNAPELIVDRIGLDGWTVNYHPSGFQVTLFPDDGSGSAPNEAAPIQTSSLQFRFSPSKPVWVYPALPARLAPGRYWVRLSPNDFTYNAVVRVGTSGPHSFSRSVTTGRIINSSFSIALRVDGRIATVVSRKLHGAAGEFDLELPLFGNPGVECRTGGTSENYQLVFTLPNAATYQSAAVTSGTGFVSNSQGSGTATITVNLTGVSNVQTLTVTLLGVNDGSSVKDISVQMAVLHGDTTNDGSVNSADIAQTKSQSGSNVSNTNFREDLTADGAVNSADIALAKSKTGTALPSTMAQRTLEPK